MRPVAADGVEDVPQNVALRDRAVDVADDDGDVVAPVEERGRTGGAVDGEGHGVSAGFQVHGFELLGGQTQRFGVVLVWVSGRGDGVGELGWEPRPTALS